MRNRIVGETDAVPLCHQGGGVLRYEAVKDRRFPLHDEDDVADARFLRRAETHLDRVAVGERGMP